MAGTLQMLRKETIVIGVVIKLNYRAFEVSRVRRRLVLLPWPLSLSQVIPRLLTKKGRTYM